MSSDQPIALFLGEPTHRLERRPSVVFRPANKLRIVRHCQCATGGDDVMGFTNYHSRIDDRDRFPYPIIHSIHVEAQKIHDAANPCRFQEIVYILSRDPRGCEHRWMKKGVLMI